MPPQPRNPNLQINRHQAREPQYPKQEVRVAGENVEDHVGDEGEVEGDH